jgi:hypothetical protein
MANLNSVMLIGNVTRDPEIRYTPKGTGFSLSSNSFGVKKEFTRNLFRPPLKGFAYPSLLKFLIRQLWLAYHYVSYPNPENNENLLSGGPNRA